MRIVKNALVNPSRLFYSCYHNSRPTISNYTINTEKYVHKSPNPIHNLYHKKYLSTDNGNGFDVEDETDIACSINGGYRISLKNILYPNSNDITINKLKDCSTSEEVYQIIEESNTNLNASQLCQVVLALKEALNHEENDNNNPFMRFSYSGNMTGVMNHPTFVKFLYLIDLKYKNMNLDELSCCLQYLLTFSVPLEHNTMANLLTRFDELVTELQPEDVPLHVISRMSVVLRKYTGLWVVYALNNITPSLVYHLNKLEDVTNLHHTCIILMNCSFFISNDIIQLFKEKCKYLLKQQTNDVLEEERHIAIIKIVKFLSNNEYHGKYYNFSRDLLASLNDNLTHLPISELFPLSTTLLMLGEPSKMFRSMTEAIKHGETQSEVQNIALHLKCMFMSNSINDEEKSIISSQLVEYLQQPTKWNDSLRSLNNVYFTIRNLNLSEDIFDLYWDSLIKHYNDNEGHAKLVWICNRYIGYTGFTKTYENEKFERILSGIIFEKICQPTVTCSPSTFSRHISFLLTFCDEFLQHQNLFDKLLKFIPRLGMMDSLMLSFSLKNSLNRKSINQRPKVFFYYYVKLIAALNKSLSDYLKNQEKIELSNLNISLLAYNHRKGPRDTEIFYDFVKRYQSVTLDELSSKSIRNSIGDLTSAGFIVPEYVDLIVDYCLKHSDYVHASTLSNILSYCYLFGFTPKRITEFLDLTVQLLHRDDKNTIDVLKLIKCAQALCFYNYLPLSFCADLFSVNFMKRLDRNVAGKGRSWKAKLRQELMKLNRSVCIDYPEYNIPWFHQDDVVVQSVISSENSVLPEFHKDVLEILTYLVGDRNLIEVTHKTHYGYHVDFVIYLSKDGIPIEYKNADYKSIKVGIVLEKQNVEEDKCYAGKGMSLLKKRHLEMLNYKVINVSQFLWDSMFMSENHAKENYLKDKIWPSECNYFKVKNGSA